MTEPGECQKCDAFLKHTRKRQKRAYLLHVVLCPCRERLENPRALRFIMLNRCLHPLSILTQTSVLSPPALHALFALPSVMSQFLSHLGLFDSDRPDSILECLDESGNKQFRGTPCESHDISVRCFNL
jgi:hypothetical protein